MKTVRTKAIVIRRTNYGEADRIVQLLTPEHGKLSAMARGVRREKSKLAGGIELFARCDVTVAHGRGELGIITSARLEHFYGSIIRDYDRLSFGYEALRQVARAAEVLDEPAFFELLDQAFASLDDTTIALDVTKAWFWLQLAILLGIGLNLTTDDHGKKLRQDERYEFDVSQSVFVPKANGRFTSDHIKLLRIMSAQPPRIITQVEGIERLLGECSWVAEHSVSH